MKKCAFCGSSDLKLTREHVFPASLHKRIEEQNLKKTGQKQNFWLKKLGKDIPSEPQVKDVCATCNNGPLSILDSYICQLWDRQFKTIVARDERVVFNYEFQLLARWLLKMCYNSARVHGSDEVHFRGFAGYILGEEATVPKGVDIHLQLISPTRITEEMRKVAGVVEGRDWFEPDCLRCGHRGYVTKSGYGRLVRAVYIQSYCFLIHVFPKNQMKRRLSDLRDFKKSFPNAILVSPRQSSCLVRCRGIDAMEDFSGSRSFY